MVVVGGDLVEEEVEKDETLEAGDEEAETLETGDEAEEEDVEEPLPLSWLMMVASSAKVTFLSCPVQGGATCKEFIIIIDLKTTFKYFSYSLLG